MVSTTNPYELPDCLLYLRSGDPGFWGDIDSIVTTDQSGYGDDMTSGTNCVYDDEGNTSYTRFDRAERTVDVRFFGAGTDVGGIWRHRQSSTLGSTARLDISTSPANGTLVCYVNGSSAHTYTIASWPASTQEEFVVCWATEPNPETTGASDAYRSELQIWNVTTGEHEHTSFTHAAFQSSPSGQMIVGAISTTGSIDYDGLISEFRVSKAFHSAVESYETFIDDTAAPTLLGEERIEFPMPDRPSGWGDAGEFAGPIYAMAARAVQHSDLLLVGPILNEQIKATAFFDSSSSQWLIDDPQGSGQELFGGLLWYRPVPLTVNRLHVRLHVQTYPDSSALSYPMRVWSMSQPGPRYRPPTSPQTFARFYAPVTIPARDDGSTSLGGEWEDLGLMRVARDRIGWTYIAVSWDLPAGQNMRVRAITVDGLQAIDNNEAPDGLVYQG